MMSSLSSAPSAEYTETLSSSGEYISERSSTTPKWRSTPRQNLIESLGLKYCLDGVIFEE